MAKSLCITYFLWLIGGWIGLHHVYLARYKHAFVWWCLPGGYLGLGWFRELWRIPEYVRDANSDPDYLRRQAEKVKTRPKPPLTLARFLGELLMGNIFGIVVAIGMPEDGELRFNVAWLAVYLVPAATALGVWTVGNIGKEKGSIIPPLVGSYLTLPLTLMGYGHSQITSLAGIIAFNWKSKEWRKYDSEPPSFPKAFTVLLLCAGLYSSMWVSYGYFNLRVHTQNGDSVKFRDAVKHFWGSPAVHQFRQNARRCWEHGWEFGWQSALEEFLESLDPLGERAASEVLQVEPGANQTTIKAKYRELTRKWHPDKVTNATEKAVAHEKFMEIQKAYETLSNIKVKRAAKQKFRRKHEKEQEEFESQQDDRQNFTSEKIEL